jgi:avirulence D protein (AvrD)
LADTRLLLRSIDDYLGPGENRFFARGYQRADYHVRDITVAPSPGSEPAVRALVDVGYPVDWSTKAGIDQRPHLSTVDALVLGVQLAELHLARGYGLTGAERAGARLRKAVLRAGGAPQQDLRGIQLSARLMKKERIPGAASSLLSVYGCTVGNLRVRCEIEHPGGRGDAPGGPAPAGLDDALGPAERRYYGEGFKARRHHIQNVRVDREAHAARADVHFTQEADPATLGIGGDAQPSVAFVDAFVVNLQLVQVLLYELDSLSRADSNTLWMMQTVLEAAAEPPAFPDRPDLTAAATASLTDKRLLPLRGGIWRSVDIAAGLAGIGIRCGFAHELPERAAAAVAAPPAPTGRTDS